MSNASQQDIIDALRLQLSFHQHNARKVLPDSNQTQQLQIHFLERRVHELQSNLSQQERRHKEELSKCYEELQEQLDAKGEAHKELIRVQSVNQTLVDELRSLGHVHTRVSAMQIATVSLLENYWRERIEKEAQRYFLLRHVESLADACATLATSEVAGFEDAGGSLAKARAVIDNVTFSTDEVVDMFSERSAAMQMYSDSQTAEALSSKAMGLVRMAQPFSLQLRFAMKGVIVDDDLENVRSAMPPVKKLVSRGVTVDLEAPSAPAAKVATATLEEIELDELMEEEPSREPNDATPVSENVTAATLEKKSFEGTNLPDEAHLRKALDDVGHLRREVAKEKHQRSLLEEEKIRWLIERSALVKEQMAKNPAATEAGELASVRSPTPGTRTASIAATATVPSVRGHSVEPAIMSGVPLHEVSPHGGFYVHQHQRPPAAAAALRTPSQPNRHSTNLVSDAEVDDALDRLEFVTKDLLNIEAIARQTPEGGMRRRLLREMDDVHNVKSSDALANARKLLSDSKPQY